MNLIRNVILFVLSLQEKLLQKQLRGTLGITNQSKRKKYYSGKDMLSLDTVAESDKSKMEEEINLILKSCEYSPEKVLEYIKNQNTKVYYIENAKYLHAVGENEGFIYPQKGSKAFYLSILTEGKLAFKTNELFILTKGEINKYYFIYHFYNWYSFKHNIAGIDSESQKLLEKYLINSSDENLKNIQLSEIYKLKDAIKQDKSAIEFVFKLCQNYEGSKNALEKLKNDGANI